MRANALLDKTSHSIEAERTVIGALLIDPEAIFKVDARLRHDDFHDPVFGAIYKAIQRLSEKGSPVDFVTVADGLKGDKKIQEIGGSAFLAQISSNVPTASHIEKYADIVIEYSHRRQLATVGQRIASLAYEESGNSASELLERAEREFLQITHKSTSRPVTLADMRNERFDRYTALYEADDPTEHYGTRTGYPALDDLLTALAPTVLAGRPSMGKTAMALDIALFVGLKQQKVVAIFSLEMTKEQVFDRIFGSLTGIAPWKLTKGMLTEEQFMEMGARDQLENQHIYVDDDPNRTLVNIRSKARRLEMQHPLDLLIIDFCS